MNRHALSRATAGNIPLLLAGAILSGSAPAATQETPAVDTSRWTCKFCPFEEAYGLTPDLGAGHVSDDSAKFGEYTGLDEDGAYVVADAEGRYRDLKGLWLDLTAIDLGLDSRYAGLEGGKQGMYRLFMSYKQLTHQISDTAASPFLGFGTSALELPSNWVPGATTGTMTALDASLRGVDLETERRLFDLGAELTAVKHWSFGVKVRHEQKTGTRGTGGSFVFNDAQLPMPIDYETDQIDAAAAYTATRIQARFAYYGSIFRNDDTALTWANPYIPLVTGGNSGQLALAPSNEFHQLALSGAYQIGPSAQITADIAFGRMTQDQALLPYTINSSLPTQPLPRRSLNGRVDTLSGNMKLTAALNDRVRVNAGFVYDDRDNRTPQSMYDWISMDTTAAAPRTNLPYSSRHAIAKIDGGIGLARGVRVDAGCNFDEYERNLQEVSRTHERSCWGKATARAMNGANFMLTGSHARRTANDYVPNPDDTPAQNPLMRIYSMADRDRDEVRMRAGSALGERFSVGLDAGVTWDTYFNSVIGLRDGRSWSAAADGAYEFSQSTSATVYLSHEQIKSSQANAELLAPAPLWFAANEDSTDSAGAGIEHQASDKLGLGIDYTYSRSVGRIDMEGATVGFPHLTTRLNSAKLYVDFRPKQKLSLRLTYWYENYQSDDWALAGVMPSTISNVLAFGQDTASYSINVVTLSARYEF